MEKPIRVFYSQLSRRFFATSRYKQEGEFVTITGKKYDVTNDIADAVVQNGVTFTPVKEATDDQ